MTDTTTAARAIPRRWDSPLVYGVAAFAAATTLSAIGVFGADQKQDQIDAFPALVVFYGILTALVFAFVVRPAAANGASSLRVAILGSLALLGNVVFWAGVPAVLGVATLAVRPHAPASRRTTVGVVLAIVALAANVIAAFVG